ncbi:MAG TPA: serine--tRNA ligase [Candidatus Aphodocola excrementigallinarum]|uniref:Serine--tRNA ligase n=1 Tax=Candidatus Aphodocola excrementigallinarum TaxID=2840670 RepID=A0A9D1LIW1_9FIRM|nr:serine--tRNA ligase [Candidatus Aphodocola excrementigallinarum]
MLDIKLIKKDKEKIENALRKRMPECTLDNVVRLDDERLLLQRKKEELQKIRNEKTKEISILKQEKQDVQNLLLDMKKISSLIKEINQKLIVVNNTLFEELSSYPNIPDDDLVAGGKENNESLYKYLKQPTFDFKEKDHIELERDLNLIDYERGVKLAGQGSWVYTGNGALLEWALLCYFVNSHLSNGWDFKLVPHMLNYDCGYVAGQFPKFKDEVYWIDDGKEVKGKFLLPTAETALVNMHSNEILNEYELPKKYFSYTPCYRREAGSSRKEERGIIRGHQFNKVEMVQFTVPEKADESFDEMLYNAEKILQGLDLHYQVSKLAAGDCSSSMTRTYDIEIWIPSMKIYKEVSSVSNCRDYQARRGNIRYKDSITGKTKLVNTLNGSGLATSRLVPALLEQLQQSDGSVIIPKVLRPYMNGMEKIEAPEKVLRRKK